MAVITVTYRRSPRTAPRTPSATSMPVRPYAGSVRERARTGFTPFELSTLVHKFGDVYIGRTQLLPIRALRPIFDQAGKAVAEEEERQRDTFTGKDVIRPGPEIVKNAWVDGFSRQKAVIRSKLPVETACGCRIRVGCQPGAPDRCKPEDKIPTDHQVQRTQHDTAMQQKEADPAKTGETVREVRGQKPPAHLPRAPRRKQARTRSGVWVEGDPDHCNQSYIAEMEGKDYHRPRGDCAPTQNLLSGLGPRPRHSVSLDHPDSRESPVRGAPA